MSAGLPLRARAAVHETRCAECRVSWRSWAARLIGVRSDLRLGALSAPAGKNDQGHATDLATAPVNDPRSWARPGCSAVDAAIAAAYDLDGLCGRRSTGGALVPASSCRACIAEAVVAGLTEAGLLR